jgi:GTPase
MSFRCGTIAIVGRPNVGKSSLLNRILGQKLSITSRKPQTTRHAIRGILTTASAQLIFVDTPGFQMRHGGVLNRSLNRAVTTALQDVDMVLMVFAAGQLNDQDKIVIDLVGSTRPTVVAMNKIDLKDGPRVLLPLLATLQAEVPNAALVPVSAKSGKGVDRLVALLTEGLPEQAAIYPPDELTDRDERFLASELVREKLFRLLGDEVPYGSLVVIDSFEESARREGSLRKIRATIFVDREGHKGIVVGHGGERLREIGKAARIDMESLFGGTVFLELWVKVKAGWADDRAALTRFGIG